MERENCMNKSGERKEEVMVEEKRSVRYLEICLRLMALSFCVAGAVTLGIDKQTATVPVPLVSTLPPINVRVTAKFNQLSAFTYLVVTNIVAGSYGALSLILILATKGKIKNGLLALTILTLDLIMVALLASGVGATAAVGLIGYNGNKHVQWNKVCDIFEKFCHQVTGAAIVSLLGSLFFVLLVVLAALDLHNKKY